MFASSCSISSIPACSPSLWHHTLLPCCADVCTLIAPAQPEMWNVGFHTAVLPASCVLVEQKLLGYPAPQPVCFATHKSRLLCSQSALFSVTWHITANSHVYMIPLQAELLRQCLACWTPDPHGRPDNSTFEKLSRFVERQSSFSWGKIIDIVQDAGFGDAFALRLCEELILR